MGLTDIVKTLDVKKCGLYSLTDQDLQRLKQIYIEMLDDIQKVCRKHRIEWILTAGSMLGAVRHKGFIPWDDDIDLNFTRENYNRFSAIFEKELGDKYILKRPGDSRYLLHFPTIQKKNTCVQQILSPDYVDNGVTMDIFIMENTYNDPFRRFMHGIGCTLYLFIDAAVKTKAAEKNVKRFSKHCPKLLYAYKIRSFFSVFFSSDAYYEYSDEIINVSHYSDAQEIILAADYMITDYSSIVFDFMLMQKPAFLLMQDYEEYRQERGFYVEHDYFPFPYAKSNAELMEKIRQFDAVNYAKRINRFSQDVHLCDTGSATAQICSMIMNKIKKEKSR